MGSTFKLMDFEEAHCFPWCGQEASSKFKASGANPEDPQGQNSSPGHSTEALPASCLLLCRIHTQGCNAMPTQIASLPACLKSARHASLHNHSSRKSPPTSSPCPLSLSPCVCVCVLLVLTGSWFCFPGEPWLTTLPLDPTKSLPKMHTHTRTHAHMCTEWSHQKTHWI
jgi:hypothetical protein